MKTPTLLGKTLILCLQEENTKFTRENTNYDAETLEISRRMEEGKAEKKKRMKEKRKFYCPYTCTFTGKKCGVHFHAFKYAGALEHLKTCEHKDVAVMKVYMLEKGLLN